MKVVVLIPMFNHGEMTQECIKHCKENAGIEHEIMVVDDGSEVPFKSDDAKKIVRLNRNSGFTTAVNSGLRDLGLSYDYVCILNNDTIPQKNFLKILIDDMENDKQVGIAASARVNNTEDFAMHIDGADLTTGEVWVSKEKDLSEVRPAVFVPFCCVVFSKRCVETVGLLDERMVNHCSDNDYCLRAVMMDIKIIVDTDSRVIHYQSVTIKENGIYPDEDQKTFAAKHFGVMMNEILSVIPVNKGLNKWGQLGFKMEVKGEPKPMIEIAKS